MPPEEVASGLGELQPVVTGHPAGIPQGACLVPRGTMEVYSCHSGGDSGISPSSAGRSGVTSCHEVHPPDYSEGLAQAAPGPRQAEVRTPIGGSLMLLPSFAQAQSQSRFFLGHSGDISPPSWAPVFPSVNQGLRLSLPPPQWWLKGCRTAPGGRAPPVTPEAPFLSPSLG